MITDKNATWSDCMRIDLKALMDCDGILVLPDWQGSRGAKLEIKIACELGMDVYWDIARLISDTK